jgi:hypothetical protein
MSIPFRYSIGILVALTAIFFMAVTAQVDNKTELNNALKNISPNSSAKNETVPIAANTEQIAHEKHVFIINEDTMKGQVNGIYPNTYDSSPKANVFIIEGFTRPTRDTAYKNQSLINAAYLSRKVEGTPHGYATYYN